MRLLALVVRKNPQPLPFTQLELIRLVGAARTKKPLPFAGASDIFDAGSIAVDQFEILHQILHLAIRAFDVQSSLCHRIRDESKAACLCKRVLPAPIIKHEPKD
jgi:hypothetical protein